jgi:hypothetical protein
MPKAEEQGKKKFPETSITASQLSNAASIQITV